MSQQYLQRIIAESSVTAARKLHGPSRRTLVNDSWRQIYSGPYKCYRQRCPDSNSTSYQKEESTTAAPDHELKSLWAIRNSHSVFQFSSASNAADDEEYQYYRDRALAYAGTTPTVTNLQTCPGNSYLVSQFFSVSDAEDDEAEYQYYRDRALAYAGITPTVTTLQTCPGNSYLVSQFSSASEADDDEAEYHYHRHRALVRPHRPLPAQNITDTRGSHLGLAPCSPSGIGCSSLCLYNSVK